jgi:glycerate dehydrogenase
VKIVILDGYTANPGDLSWAEFEALGECAVHDRTTKTQVVERARTAAIVLTNKTILDRAAIEALPELRYIGVLATGYNVVDARAARERHIPVCNVPDYSTASVAQTVFALLLELTNGAGAHSQSVRAGEWSSAPDFCYWKQPLVELHGLTFGIVGFGRIGRAVARIAQALGMRVLASRRDQATGESEGVHFVSLDTLFRESDVISLHCPLTDHNRGFVNAARLAQMKPTAYLLNTARGPLVNEADLVAALNEGRIAGAGLDVLSVEPPPPDNPLLRARRCVITPHHAWGTRAARERLLKISAANIRAFLAGNPVNAVN